MRLKHFRWCQYSLKKIVANQAVNTAMMRSIGMYMAPMTDARVVAMNVNVRNNSALTSFRSFISLCASEKSDPTSAN